MKIQPTLLLVDSQITGFELGDISLCHNGVEINSAGHTPSRSMMMFIFLCDFIELLISIRKNKSRRPHTIVAASSSFKLTIKSDEINLTIQNEEKIINVPFQAFLRTLDSDLHIWLDSIQPNLHPVDSALLDFYGSLDKLKQLQ